VRVLCFIVALQVEGGDEMPCQNAKDAFVTEFKTRCLCLHPAFEVCAISVAEPARQTCSVQPRSASLLLSGACITNLHWGKGPTSTLNKTRDKENQPAAERASTRGAGDFQDMRVYRSMTPSACQCAAREEHPTLLDVGSMSPPEFLSMVASLRSPPAFRPARSLQLRNVLKERSPFLCTC